MINKNLKVLTDPSPKGEITHKKKKSNKKHKVRLTHDQLCTIKHINNQNL